MRSMRQPLKAGSIAPTTSQPLNLSTSQPLFAAGMHAAFYKFIDFNENEH